MSLSRLLVVSGHHLGPLRGLASASHGHGHATAVITRDPDRDLPPERQENPGFFSKIMLRFKGIPLKGEAEPPRCMLSDMDKHVAMPVFPDVKDYKEHPDRDLKNYPYPLHPMYGLKTRLLLIPDSWFHPFYKVTGTTGPYLFFGGFYAFIIGKGLMPMDENWVKCVVFVILYAVISRTAGYKIDKWWCNLNWQWLQKREQWKEEELSEVKKFRTESSTMTDSLAAMKDNIPVIAKENMALQLEATYRQNVAMVAAEMKRRLDYLQETEATKRRFEREHQLKWILNQVREQISTNKDNIKDKYLDSCINSLKDLSVAKSAA